MKKKENVFTKLLNNKYSKITAIVCLVAILAIIVNIVLVSIKSTGDGDVLDTSSTLTNNGVYNPPTNPTDYQEELYKELTNLLNGYDFASEAVDSVKNKELVISLVKNYIADFYTWTNKSSSYSVGGQSFVFGDLVITFQNQARENFYKDLDGYIAQYGRDQLIEVTSIEADGVYGETFPFNEEKYTNFYVEAKWEYKETELDTSSWPKKAAFNVIYNPTTERWEIATTWSINE